MAKKSKAGRTKQTSTKRAKDIRNVLNQGVALQIELLGAAVKIWSTMFESMAAYSKATSTELMNFTGSGDANAALDSIIKAGHEKLVKLEKLPQQIGATFRRNVRARAKN